MFFEEKLPIVSKVASGAPRRRVHSAPVAWRRTCSLMSSQLQHYRCSLCEGRVIACTVALATMAANVLDSPAPAHAEWSALEVEGSLIHIKKPSEAVAAALQNVGQDDPAIFLDWQISKLRAAVAQVNALQQRPLIPAWMAVQYPLTEDAVALAIAGELAAAGSGNMIGGSGGAVLAPNSLCQFTAIRERIILMCGEQIIVSLAGNGNVPLARVYVIADGKRPCTGEHMPPLHMALPGYVNAFM